MKLKVIIPLDEYNKLIEYADKFAEINRERDRRGKIIDEALNYLTSDFTLNHDSKLIAILRKI